MVTGTTMSKLSYIFKCNVTKGNTYIIQNENNTDYCRFCYNVPVTLMPMLWECHYVQKLWKTLWKLVSIYTTENIDTGMCNITFCACN